MRSVLNFTALISSLTILTFACGVNNNDESIQASENKSAKLTEKGVARTVYNIVDQIPLFGGCEDVDCSNQKLIAYIGDNLNYPDEAKQKSLEGRVFVQFVVEADGYVSNIEVKRGLGGGASEEAFSIVESFNENGPAWKSGIHEGEEVAVRFTLPFTFKLES